ncbi:hypothetical protein ACH5RR_021356 [Cinchona calisaya]|uniref:MULE transposase domain-containing protein n=1 Tax=Cinchona calisaya TaxID=153742 RepID=A0ABD2ZJY2_9GENT
MQAYRAKKHALKAIQGDCRYQHLNIRDYCATMIFKNPGSIVLIRIESMAINRNPVFRRMFVMYATQSKGFIDGCRLAIGLEACHLKGVYKGQSMHAVGRDTNNKMFPLAIALVESECKDSWSWILEILTEHIGMPTEKGWFFISDRRKAISIGSNPSVTKGGHANAATIVPGIHSTSASITNRGRGNKSKGRRGRDETEVSITYAIEGGHANTTSAYNSMATSSVNKDRGRRGNVSQGRGHKGKAQRRHGPYASFGVWNGIGMSTMNHFISNDQNPPRTSTSSDVQPTFLLSTPSTGGNNSTRSSSFTCTTNFQMQNHTSRLENVLFSSQSSSTGFHVYQDMGS